MMRALACAMTIAAVLTAGRCVRADAPAGEHGAWAAARLHDLNLTDEQEAKIGEIRKESQPKIAAARQEFGSIVREEVEKVSAVLTPDQREKVRAMREQRRENRAENLAEAMARFDDLDLSDAEMAKIAEIRNEYRPKIMNAMKGFQGILNDDQRKAREEALKAGKSRREMWQSLNLTDDQKQKARAVCSEVRGLVHEQMDAIKGVLTAEQQEKLADIREERHDRIRDRFAAAVENFRDLNLTDEQKNQIHAIRMEYRPKVHDAAMKLRAAVRDELSQIGDVIKGG